MLALNIVLLEPQIPQNTGNIARTCAAVGAALHLIHPLGFSVTDKAVRRAGLDYWHLLPVFHYQNLAEFFSKTVGSYYLYTTKSDQNHTTASYQRDCFLLFGREDAGLPESLLYANPSWCYRIPMVSDSRSLNLSNAAAIAAYEVLRQWDFPNLNQP